MTPRRQALGWLLWVALLAMSTTVLVWARSDIEQSHAALTLLLVVLGGSVGGGRVLGVSLACVSFGLIDYYFQAPYDRISVGKPLDWVVLTAFLATAIAATDLLARARSEADAARARAGEIDSLSRLGADTLRFADATEALAAIADLVRRTIGATTCTIQLWDESHALAAASTAENADARSALESSENVRASELAARSQQLITLDAADVTTTLDVSQFVANGIFLPRTHLVSIPLVVEKRTVAVLTVVGTPCLQLDASGRRFLVALAHYATLGVERLRLVGDAERLHALREANRAKDEVLATVSHDLRTPLTTIKVLAQDEDIASHPSALAIVDQADRLSRMVGDVLELSRLRAGGLPLTMELNMAEDVIGAVLRQVRGALGDRVIRRRIDFENPALAGLFDFVHTLRIIANLVENALRYSPAGGEVEVGAEREQQTLVFTVADRGPGVAHTERDRIFDAFYRPRDQAPDAGHAGLGLSIARTLADLQHGSLTYEPRDGGGSVFTLRLPAADVDVDREDRQDQEGTA